MAERDRLLTRSESLSLAEHAKGCLSCLSLVAEERRMRALLRSARLAPVEVPEDFAARVHREVARRAQALARTATAPARTATAPGPTWGSSRRMLFIAAGLVVAGLVGLRFASQFGPASLDGVNAALPASAPASLRPRLLWSDGRAEIVESPHAEQAALREGAPSDVPVLTTASIVEWSF